MNCIRPDSFRPAGIKLRQWRTVHKLSQEEVAELLQYAPRTIQCWEHGTKLPGYDAIISIATLMDVSIDWLVGRSNDARTSEQLKEELALRTNRFSFS